MLDTLNPVKLLAIGALFLTTLTSSPENPDTIYIHANILTGAHLRPKRPLPTPAKVTAIAIAEGKIQAAGNDEDLLKLKGPQTKIVDLQNAFVMPGFNDAHTHIAFAGQQNSPSTSTAQSLWPRCSNASKPTPPPSNPAPGSKAEDGTTPSGPAKRFPPRTDIDAVTANHPAILYPHRRPHRNRRQLRRPRRRQHHRGHSRPLRRKDRPRPLRQPHRHHPRRRSPHTWFLSKIPRPPSNSAARHSPWPSPTSSPTESPPCRTTPSGTTSSPSRNSNTPKTPPPRKRVAPFDLPSQPSNNAGPATLPTTRSSTPAC